jgi:alpha-glucuronidase
MKNKNDILIFAFRYALGRMTSAPGIVIDTLIDEWEDLSFADKTLIQSEIQAAFIMNRAGMDCDREYWSKLLKLPL